MIILWPLMRPIIIYNFIAMLSQISRGIQKGAVRNAQVNKLAYPALAGAPSFSSHQSTQFRSLHPFSVHIEGRGGWNKQML